MLQARSLRALVLAAGRGERLRPLSELSPKPLLPVMGVSILERTLARLAAAGVESAAVNLHHLGTQIRHRLGTEVGGMPLTYWPETELLGTLGPLGRLRAFFGSCDPVLLVNGDSLCHWPVEAVVRAHRSQNAQATLLLSSRADPASFGGGVVVDSRGRILSFRGEESTVCTRCGVFAGFHAISPESLTNVGAIPSDIVRNLYEPLLASGALIRGVFTRRPWHDLGTPRRYLEGVLEVARGLGGGGSGDFGVEGGVLVDGGWRHERSQVQAGAEVSGSVLERGAVVEADSSVEGSLLMTDVCIGAASRVRGSIIGPGVELAAESSVDSALLTLTGENGALVSAPL